MDKFIFQLLVVCLLCVPVLEAQGANLKMSSNYSLTAEQPIKIKDLEPALKAFLIALSPLTGEFRVHPIDSIVISEVRYSTIGAKKTVTYVMATDFYGILGDEEHTIGTIFECRAKLKKEEEVWTAVESNCEEYGYADLY